jgi:hypothetical protein
MKKFHSVSGLTALLLAPAELKGKSAMKLVKCFCVFFLTILAAVTTYADDLVVTGPFVTTVSGTVDGDVIVVDGGTAFLNNALVEGDVVVWPGGALFSSGASTSIIEGDVQAEEALFIRLFNDDVVGDVQVRKSGDGNRFVDIFGSLVGGDVQFEENDAARVRVGLPGSGGVHGNMILGDVEVFKNVATFEILIVENDIGGDLQCAKNLATSEISEILITENDIGGDLQCGENDPDPIISGNVVAGDVQCND